MKFLYLLRGKGFLILKVMLVKMIGLHYNGQENKHLLEIYKAFGHEYTGSNKNLKGERI